MQSSSRNHPGDFIKNARKERGVSQSKLCSGLCDVSTLSRIERGIIMPSSFLTSALMERLGYYAFEEKVGGWNDSNPGLIQRKKLLSRAFIQKDVATAEAIIAELSGYHELSEGLGLQFTIIIGVILTIVKYDLGLGFFDPVEGYKALHRALLITIPGFNEENISNYMLTKEELSGINAISATYYHVKDYEGVLRIQLALKKNMDKFCINKYNLLWNYSATLYNIAETLLLLRRYRECDAACSEGRKFCIEYNDYSMMPPTLYIHGRCLYATGQKNAAKSVLQEAFFTARAFRRDVDIRLISGLYHEIFSVNIEDENFDQSDQPRGHSASDKVTKRTTDQASGCITERSHLLVHILGDRCMSTKEIMKSLNLRHRANFKANYLMPLISAGLVEMTNPDNPNDPRQRYRVTDSARVHPHAKES